MKHFIFIVLILLSSNLVAQNNTLFELGNTLYNDANYSEAINKYETIINNGKHSSELYFNLGNAHYKLNHIAPSIYYYEKALKLSPNDKDIQNNIAFARNMTIDAIDIVPEVGFSKLIKNTTNSMNFDSWAKLAVIFMILFVFLILIYHIAYLTSKKRLAFIGSVVFLFLACSSIGFAFNKYGIEQNDKPAIVFVKESRVKSEPNLRSGEAFRLHEGTKVHILDTINNWKKIKLSDGKTGWISNQDIKQL